MTAKMLKRSGQPSMRAQNNLFRGLTEGKIQDQDETKARKPLNEEIQKRLGPSAKPEDLMITMTSNWQTRPHVRTSNKNRHLPQIERISLTPRVTTALAQSQCSKRATK